MYNRLLFALFIVLIGFTTGYAQFSPIHLQMVVRDNGVSSKTITWGADPAATSGVDFSLGEVQLPPFPPAGSFDARWVNYRVGAPGIGTGLSIDLRAFASHTQKDTFEIKFQPGPFGFPMKLIWSHLLVRQNYGCRATLSGSANSMQDQHGVMRSSVDMFTDDSIMVIDNTIQNFLVIVSCPLGSNSIQGHIFNDLNNNGIEEGGEIPIAGRSVALSGDASANMNTDASGNFSFPDLINGTYSVHEYLPGSWSQTSHVGDYTFTLTDGQIGAANFGNYQTTFGNFISIRLDLTIHDQGGASRTITWGMDPDATSGIDPLLGESQLPPLPPGGSFDARWTNYRVGVPGIGTGVSLDLRPFSNHFQIDTFKVRFQPGGGDIR